jgi:alpha-1,3-rhamnosyl/mannosyltransferase
LALFCFDARTAGPHFPGIGRYTRNLARALAGGLGAQESLLLLCRRGGDDGLVAAHEERVSIRYAEVTASPFALWQHWQVPVALRRCSANTYHAPYPLMPLRPGVPALVTVHDLIPLRLPQYFSAWQRQAFAFAVRLALRAATTVIAISQATAQDLRSFFGLPAERIAIIPEGVDPIFTLRSGAPREDLLLFVGSNKPHKNLVRLIEAWARLQPRRETLVVAGPWDPRYPEARRRVEELGLGGAVRFVGHVSDVELAALYGAATLCVVPSEWEGFGLPALEAMACGTAVACSHAGALPEVVGDAALLFDPLDVDAIAAAIRVLLDDADRRVELTRRGLERVRQFSWERAAAATLALHRRLLASGP